MTRQDELNEAWCKYMGKFSTEIMQALAFALRWCDEHPNWEAIVKRLQEEITNDLRKDRWISVEDELPKNGDCVLIYSKYWYMDVSIYNNGEWDCGSRGSEYLQNQVTHWMKLPEPPKKGGEE